MLVLSVHELGLQRRGVFLEWLNKNTLTSLSDPGDQKQTKHSQRLPKTHHGEPLQTLQDLAHSAARLKHKPTHAYFQSVKQQMDRGNVRKPCVFSVVFGLKNTPFTSLYNSPYIHKLAPFTCTGDHGQSCCRASLQWPSWYHAEDF